MDLRKYDLSPKQIEVAAAVLNYQPFIISDEVQTGVAYSWLYGGEGGRQANATEFVLRRQTVEPLLWNRFAEANQRLRAMYDDWISIIAEKYPASTLLDPACNNGYFLVQALEKGMSRATGYDRADYSRSVEFLNRVTGRRAKFIHRSYNSWTHEIKGCKPHDVAVASLIMCHISDPLYFLAFLGKMARKAIFYFGGMGDEPGYRVYYSKPNRFYHSDEFPVCFDNDVGISRELLFDSFSSMGFKHIEILPYREQWLPARWYNLGNQHAILAMR